MCLRTDKEAVVLFSTSTLRELWKVMLNLISLNAAKPFNLFKNSPLNECKCLSR